MPALTGLCTVTTGPHPLISFFAEKLKENRQTTYAGGVTLNVTLAVFFSGNPAFFARESGTKPALNRR
jgi:hypothetical protein